MKKLFFALAFLVIALTLLCTSCGTETLDKKTLNVYNWGEYISDGSDDLPNVNELFEEYFNENLAEEFGYEIEVNYSTYASNEDMYNKISSGSGSFDIVIPSDYMIEQMIGEGLLRPLDYTKIPNYENIDDKFKNEFSTYDPEGKHSVPYTYGTVGILYNSEYVDEEDLGGSCGTCRSPWSSIKS